MNGVSATGRKDINRNRIIGWNRPMTE